MEHRRWDVLLIGGASGTGKTSISYRLASHFGVGVTEFDDIVEAIKAITTPQQQPTLHHWDTHPEAMSWTPQQIVDLTQAVCEQLHPAAEAVVGNHLETKMPIVLEGDCLLPRLATQARFGNAAAAGRVRGIFLFEPDEEQISANLSRREPTGGDMTVRAHVSWMLGAALRLECEGIGVPALTARPWATLLDRVCAAVS